MTASRRYSVHVLVALLLVIAACASPAPGPVSGSSCADAIQRFFDAYNRADLDAALSMLDFSAGTFSYADALGGGALQLRDRSVVAMYLRSRFALGERFLVGRVDVPPGINSPAFELERQVGAGVSPGNAKIVCSGDRLGGIVMSAPEAPDDPCPVSPTSSFTAQGHVLLGKKGGDAFFYLYPDGRERRLSTFEKFLVFLADAGSEPVPTIDVRATNLTSPRNVALSLPRHESEYGIEWGGNVDFGEAGCWWIEVSSPRHRGAVVIRLY